MTTSVRSEFEDTLKWRETELAKAKDRYNRLNQEYRTIRSALDILAHDERNGNCSDSLKKLPKGQHRHSSEGQNPTDERHGETS